MPTGRRTSPEGLAGVESGTGRRRTTGSGAGRVEVPPRTGHDQRRNESLVNRGLADSRSGRTNASGPVPGHAVRQGALTSSDAPSRSTSAGIADGSRPSRRRPVEARWRRRRVPGRPRGGVDQITVARRGGTVPGRRRPALGRSCRRRFPMAKWAGWRRSGSPIDASQVSSDYPTTERRLPCPRRPRPSDRPPRPIKTALLA